MRDDLPSGTVTFLFTDVERSTRLLGEVGAERFAQALADHRAALREVCLRHGGVEVDTQGDAFFVAFARASDAVAAAADAQAALAAAPVRVRMGIHTGEPLLTDEGYVGMDVHRAARIAAAAHGGQVLVSQATRDLAGANGLRYLGEHRLKDLSAAEPLWQLGDEDFPPPQSLHRTNVSRPETPLMGRKKELADLLKLLGPEGARIVTLTGTGGVGKTRLALEVAAELVSELEDGVWLVDLSTIREPALVLPGIAGALRADRDLPAFIGNKRLLLVLDNFEQVVGAASEVSSLLSACPRLQILATSRERLRIRSEQAYPLRPLAEAPAVELFRRCAEAVDPDFGADYAHIAAICERVDRLPLAVELVAARVGVLGVDALLGRLDDRLPLLTSRARDVPERQRTLTATIDWSYELLTESERTLFARLAVFAGGSTVSAAERVADAALDDVESLVEKNLVRCQGERLGFLETIHEYACGKLRARTEATELRRRHADYFVALAERLQPDIWERPALLAEFEREYPNVRAALEWSKAVGDDELLLRLAVSASDFWIMKAQLHEGRAWLEAAVAGNGADGRARAVAYAALSAVEFAQGEYVRAQDHGDVALRLAREAGDAGVVANALNRIANAASGLGETERARALYSEAADCARRAGDNRGLAIALLNAGAQDASEGRHASATEACTAALEVFTALGNMAGRAICFFYLAQVATLEGRLDQARELLAQSISLYVELDRAGRIAPCFELAAAIAFRGGDAPRAARLIGAAASIRDEIGSTPMPTERAVLDETIASVRAVLGGSAFAEESSAGADLGLEQAVQLALSLDSS